MSSEIDESTEAHKAGDHGVLVERGMMRYFGKYVYYFSLEKGALFKYSKVILCKLKLDGKHTSNKECGRYKVE